MDKSFQNQEGCQICVPGLVYFPWKSGSLLQNQEELAALNFIGHQSRIDSHKFSFIPQVNKDWNDLPESRVFSWGRTVNT